MSERAGEQLKHLEFVHANIGRMHDAATSMKRFALVAFALGGSLARILTEPVIFGMTGFVVAAFFLLDAKYLQAERSFRSLFDRIRAEPPGAPASFELTPTRQRSIPLQEFRSWSTWLLYGPILLILLVLWICAEPLTEMEPK